METVAKLEKGRCTGCGVCSNSCPNNCINMVADEEGFLYPKINGSFCDACGVCSMVCPVIYLPIYVNDSEGIKQQVYAAWSLDRETRYHSTSGGIFTELAKAVLHNGGAIAAAQYDAAHMVCHGLVENEENLSVLRQSKYAQSETKSIYQKVNTLLNSGRQVLFVGTPCQCAAMKRFADHRELLILCDFICRGVNSPLAYAKYLQELEMQHKSKIRRVWFKNKKYGWNAFGTQIEFKNGEVYFGGRDDDPFMFGYIKKGLNLYLRPSCGQCEFKGTIRPTDITLGDFWGVRLEKSMDDMKNGVSAVIIHTETGRRVFDKIRHAIFAEEHTIEQIVPGNLCLTSSAQRDEKRSKRFIDLLQAVPFSEALWQICEDDSKEKGMSG